MEYDFDAEISRRGTSSVKWEFFWENENLSYWERTDPSLGDERVLPMWVADMDFPCPQPVVDALVERARQAIYGYTAKTETYYEAVVNWMERRQRWTIESEWICTTPGVVPALNLLVRTFVAAGDGAIDLPEGVKDSGLDLRGNTGASIADAHCPTGWRRAV